MTVSYGPWEIAPDVAPVAYLSSVDERPLLRYTLRRRRYETWWVNGQKMGRWDWEYAI
jgi:hypothetical protein